MPQTKIQGKFYPLQHEEFIKLNKHLTQSELAVYLWLKTNDPFGDKLVEADTLKISEDLNISRRTVQRALVKLIEEKLISKRVRIREANEVEKRICHHLQAQLGGLREVSTPAGRIDLLTEDEIIEIKRINDWKAALGQILVYSAFYPEHRKRIHLFGKCSELTKLPDIEAACLAFDVNVTAEEV
jgi:DNA-binding transcriptional MocR family regulator